LTALQSLRELFASGNRLKTLPDWLSCLANLEYLVISDNCITQLPDDISKLQKLTHLIANSNALKDLPVSIGQLTHLISLGLSENKLERLPESLSELKHLQSLGLNANRLTVLPMSFGQLIELRELGLKNNNLTAIPESMGELINLRRLDLSHNGFSELPDIFDKLSNLTDIFLRANYFTSLCDSICKLQNIRRIDLSKNHLLALPRALQNISPDGALFLHGNDALRLPHEILGPTFEETILKGERPAKPAVILDYYFRLSAAGKRRLNEAKLIFVGRGGVGKTCLIKRLLHGTFNKREIETPGIEIQSWEIEVPSGDNVRLHVWDFGGQEILHATHQFFLTERTLYVLVLSGREGKPSEDAEYWLQLIRSFGGDSKVVIALNKINEHPFDVNRGFLLEKYPFIVDFIKTDCADSSGLENIRSQILLQTDLIEHRKTDFPKDWFAIKERLAQMTRLNENYVTWERYQDICRTHGEKDIESQKKLAWYLNLLGIALNYRDDPRLKETHVLNPRWVTDGIYPLLRAGQNRGSDGILELKDISRVLNTKQYPEDKHEFLISLMEKFKLCFLLPGRTGKSKQWLVPELLGENQPDIKQVLEAPALGFRYQYEVLPESILPRFIVQTHMHSGTNPQWRWRTGVVLDWEDCRAVVRADNRERRIDIRVSGPTKRRRELLAIIRDRFAEQHNELKGVVFSERIIITDEKDSTGKDVTVSYRDLLQRETDGEVEFRPEGARQKVRIIELLNGVESSEFRSNRREKELQQSTTGGTFIFNSPANITLDQHTMHKTTNIRVGTNYGQVGEVLTNCTNIINEQSNKELKLLLEKLDTEVRNLINALPSTIEDVKTSAVEDLESIINVATAKKPVRKWFDVSAAGLLEASEFVKDFSGNLAQTICQLGKFLWPGFELTARDERDT